MTFIMKFINIAPVYYKEWWAQGGMSGGKS